VAILLTSCSLVSLHTSFLPHLLEA
jgi:hypothetical protein